MCCVYTASLPPEDAAPGLCGTRHRSSSEEDARAQAQPELFSTTGTSPL